MRKRVNCGRHRPLLGVPIYLQGVNLSQKISDGSMAVQTIPAVTKLAKVALLIRMETSETH